MYKNFGCLRSWRYSKICPEVSLRIGIARLWINWSGCRRLAAWAGVMTLAMGVVCDIVRQAIVPGYVSLSTLGGGGSTVCDTLDLVRHAMVSFFPGLMAKLVLTGLY